MKLSTLKLIAGPALLAVAASFLTAAVPADLTNAKIRQAVAYIKANHPTGTDGLDAALAANGINAGKYHDDIKQMVVVMQDLLARNEGVVFDDAGFWDLYRDTLKVPPAAPEAPAPEPAAPAPAAPAPAPTPAAEEEKPAAAPAAPVPPAAPAATARPAKGAPTQKKGAAVPAAPVAGAPVAAPEANAAPAAPANLPDAMQALALAIYTNYAAANPADKDTDDAFTKFLTDQGLASGKLHDLVTQARAAQKASGAAPGSDALQKYFAAVVAASAPASTPATPKTSDDPMIALTNAVTTLVTQTNKTQADQKKKDDTATATATGSVPFASFFSGVRTLAPYTISTAATSPGRIDSSASNSQAFLEFVFSNTWAWQTIKVAQAKKANDADKKAADAANGNNNNNNNNNSGVLSTLTNITNGGNNFQWMGNKFVPSDAFDYTARLGYDFSVGSQPSASTIAGSGDFSAEFTLGKQIFRGWSEDLSNSYSFDLVGSWAGVTDRSALRIHNRWLVGPGANFGFVDPVTSRRALFSLRAGLYSRVDQVQRGPTTVATDAAAQSYRPVLLSEGHPVYGTNSKSQAFEAELSYPLSASLYLSLGGRLYGHMDPDLWNVYVGVTLPMDKITAAFSATAPSTTTKTPATTNP